jgi:hypothetical protein
LIQNTKHKTRKRLNGLGNANALTTTIEQKPQKTKKKQMQRQYVNHHDTANKETNKMPIR